MERMIFLEEVSSLSVSLILAGEPSPANHLFCSTTTMEVTQVSLPGILAKPAAICLKIQQAADVSKS